MALVEGMCTNFNMFFKFTKAIPIKKLLWTLLEDCI